MTHHIAARIRTLIQDHLDWDYFIQLATYHALTPLVYENLYKTASTGCPQNVLDQLEAIALVDVTRHVFLTQELLKVLDLFAAHAIPVIPYKGPVLAASSYKKPVLRVFHDLDLLVHKWDYHFSIDKLLTSHGWRACSEYGWEKGFVNGSGQVVLDVHETITHREMPFRLNFNRAWKRCATIPIAGRQLKTFHPSDLLIILCIQMAKDVAANKIQLSKICDIAEFIRSHPSIDWEEVTWEARHLGVQRILHLGLHTTQDLLGTSLPNHILEEDQIIKQIRPLVNHVRECITKLEGSTYSHPELLNKTYFHTRVRERIQDRVDPKYTYLITTNVYDYSFVQLPRAWFLLYSVVRPIRLVCKYGPILFRRLFG